MRGKLYFFESAQISSGGMRRGLGLTAILLLINIIAGLIFQDELGNPTVWQFLTYFVLLVIVASALSVFQANSLKNQILFSALVGLTIFGTWALGNFSLSIWDPLTATWFALFGILQCVLAGCFLYSLLPRFPV
jgi:uncharacterized membrane protein